MIYTSKSRYFDVDTGEEVQGKDLEDYHILIKEKSHAETTEHRITNYYNVTVSRKRQLIIKFPEGTYANSNT